MKKKFAGHRIVIGTTGSGKGVFSASYAEAWIRAGGKVYLLCNKQAEYDDFPDVPGQTFKTMDQFRFLEEIKKLSAPERGFVDTLAVIDEGWNWKWESSDGTGLEHIPNAARAHGVEMLVQAQYPYRMEPTVRINCDNIICFRSKRQTAQWAAREYHDVFEKVDVLEMGRYVGKNGIDAPYLGCAWYTDSNGVFKKA